MNTESILQASVLDIIFENRNKEYGAYELRTRYGKRLKKAMTIMVLVVILFCAVIYIVSHYFHQQFASVMIPAEFIPQIITIKKDETKFEAIKPKSPEPFRRVAMVQFVTPRIVHFSQPAKPFPTVSDLVSSQIGPE